MTAACVAPQAIIPRVRAHPRPGRVDNPLLPEVPAGRDGAGFPPRQITRALPRLKNSMMAVALENSALSAWFFKVSADHIRSLDGLDFKPRLPFLLF